MMTDSHEKKQNRDAAKARSRILAEFRAVFTGESGQRVLGLLKQSAGYGRPSFLPAAGGGPIDPYAAAFRDGRKSLIDEILANLATAEDAGEAAGPQAVR